MQRPPYFMLAGLALSLAFSAEASDPPATAVAEPSAEAARATEAARAAEARARQASQADRLREALEAGSQAEIAAATEAARRELRASQEELGRLAARMAELSVRLQGQDFERAIEVARFGRPVLGVVLAGDDERGARLAAVSPKSPAAEAGLRPGDRVLAIDGKDIGAGTADQRLQRARELIGRPEEGQTVRLRVESAGNRRDLSLQARRLNDWNLAGVDPTQLAERMQALAAPHWEQAIEARMPLLWCGENDDCSALLNPSGRGWADLQLATLNPELGRYFGSDQGVLVLRGSKAVPELRGGDVLLKVDGEAVSSPSELMRALRSGDPEQPRQLQLLRDRQAQTLALQVPRQSLRAFLLAPPAPPAAPTAPTPPAAPKPPKLPAASATPSAVPAPPPQPAPPPPSAPGVLESVLS